MSLKVLPSPHLQTLWFLQRQSFGPTGMPNMHNDLYSTPRTSELVDPNKVTLSVYVFTHIPTAFHATWATQCRTPADKQRSSWLCPDEAPDFGWGPEHTSMRILQNNSSHPPLNRNYPGLQSEPIERALNRSAYSCLKGSKRRRVPSSPLYPALEAECLILL